MSVPLSLFVLEANPEKFNSRFRNKMFYAGVSSSLSCPTHTRMCPLTDEGDGLEETISLQIKCLRPDNVKKVVLLGDIQMF